MTNNQAKIQRINDKLLQLAAEITACRACDLCNTRIHALPGEGNSKTRLLFIAQAPGEMEDKEGHMFIGPSGKVLDNLLSMTSISRKDIYITNLIKCYLPGCRRPKTIEIEHCIPYLKREINIIQPTILVPMGYYATRSILELFGVHPQPRKDYIDIFGKLIIRDNQKIYPVQHPAAILHKPELETVIEKNYLKLKILKKSCKWIQVCPINYLTKTGKIKSFWQQYYCDGDWQSCKRYQLEEKGIYHPDNMLPNGNIITV